jgi:urease accessory protein
MNHVNRRINMKSRLLLAMLLLLPITAFAHPGHGAHGLLNGFIHPFSGWDHCIEMWAVGLWAAMAKGKNQFAILGGFLAGMLLGGALGMSFAVPAYIETAVAATALAAALLVVLALRLPIVAQVGLTVLFAVTHGLAHGAELPHEARALSYGLGFMLASSILLSTGWAIGRKLGSEPRQRKLGLLLALAAGGFIAS